MLDWGICAAIYLLEIMHACVLRILVREVCVLGSTSVVVRDVDVGAQLVRLLELARGYWLRLADLRVD